MPSLGGLDGEHTTSIPDRQTKVIIMFWVNYVFGHYLIHHIQFCLYPFNCVSLVSNFLMLCQVSTCHYLLDGNCKHG